MPKKLKVVKRLVLLVEGCVEPSLVGPYKTAKARDTKARTLRNANEDDGVFWLNVLEGNHVEVGAYSGGFMEGKEGFLGSE
jgi:hypothetical protein